MSERGMSAPCNASVMVYDDREKRWRQAGSSTALAEVCVYKNTGTNTYRVVGRILKDREVVINCNIRPLLKYNRATSTFHQWRDEAGTVYGLNFPSSDDANTFAKTMEEALSCLRGASSKNSLLPPGDRLVPGPNEDKSDRRLVPDPPRVTGKPLRSLSTAERPFSPAGEAPRQRRLGRCGLPPSVGPQRKTSLPCYHPGPNEDKAPIKEDKSKEDKYLMEEDKAKKEDKFLMEETSKKEDKHPKKEDKSPIKETSKKEDRYPIKETSKKEDKPPINEDKWKRIQSLPNSRCSSPKLPKKSPPTPDDRCSSLCDLVARSEDKLDFLSELRSKLKLVGSGPNYGAQQQAVQRGPSQAEIDAKRREEERIEREKQERERQERERQERERQERERQEKERLEKERREQQEKKAPPSSGGIPPPPVMAGGIPPPPVAAGGIPPPPTMGGGIPPPPTMGGGVPPPPAKGNSQSSGAVPPPPSGAGGGGLAGALAAAKLKPVAEPPSGGAGLGGLAAAIAGAKLKKAAAPEESSAPPPSSSSSGGGGMDLMGELQKKMRLRKVAADGGGDSANANAPKPVQNVAPKPAATAGVETKRPWQKNNASNSTTPGTKKPTNNSSSSGDLEQLKQEILAEMKSEMQKIKEEIITAIREELRK